MELLSAHERSGAAAPDSSESLPKIRISKIGGRYLVFDLADVSRLRRQHSLCAFLVGLTPQAPNQNVFNGLPLELAPDEARWLVHDQRVAYVADDWAAHLAALESRAARRAYADAVRQQRQAAQAVADAAAAEREKAAAEARARAQARMASRGGANKPGRAGKASKKATQASTSADKRPPPVTGADGKAVAAAVPVQGISADAEANVKTPKKTSLMRVTPTTSAGLVGSVPDEESSASRELLPRLPPSSPAASAYAFRAHLANRGFFATPGLRFGGALSIYPGDPFRYHAHFVATSYGWDEPIPLLDLVGTGRLATGVKKGLLIGGSPPDADADGNSGDGEDQHDGSRVRSFTLEWAAI